MAPITMSEEIWSKLKWSKRVWGMFFALDNAAEYGHWVVDDKAKNIFRNNFNTALSEQGTMRMLQQIHKKVGKLLLELSHFHFRCFLFRSCGHTFTPRSSSRQGSSSLKKR